MRADGTPLVACFQLYATHGCRVKSRGTIIRDDEIDRLGVGESVVFADYVLVGRRVDVDVALVIPRIKVESILANLALRLVFGAGEAEVGARPALPLPVQHVSNFALLAFGRVLADLAVVELAVARSANVIRYVLGDLSLDHVV